MIIDPHMKAVQKQCLNCYDNWTIWQRIMYQPLETNGGDSSGTPYMDVGKFILCCRRYSVTGTESCASCRKETTCWANNICGDRKYADLVGGFVAFINKRLSSKTAMFIINQEDIIPKTKIIQKDGI